MSLWSNRLKKYDEVKSFLGFLFCFYFFIIIFFFIRKSSLSSSDFVFFFCFIWFYFFHSLPLTLILIWTTSTAYMCLRDAVRYIYTHSSGDLMCPFTGRWNIPPSIYRKGRSWKCRPMHGQLPWPRVTGRRVAGWCVSFRVKVRRVRKKQSFSFSKPYDYHQCCKKRSNTQF